MWSRPDSSSVHGRKVRDGAEREMIRMWVCTHSSSADINFYEYIYYISLCVCMCVFEDGGAGWVGWGFKAGTMLLPWQHESLKFLPPLFFFFFFFLQLDVTTRSALFSSQLLSPRSPLSHHHSYCSIKNFSLWRLKPIPSQTQCYFWLYSRLRLWLCAVQCLTCECAKDGKKRKREKKRKDRKTWLGVLV